MPEHDYDCGVEEHALGAQDPVGEPGAKDGGQVHTAAVGPDEAGCDVAVDGESAFGDREVHVVQQDSLHAVEREPFPQLDAEQVGQHSRLPEERRPRVARSSCSAGTHSKVWHSTSRKSSAAMARRAVGGTLLADRIPRPAWFLIVVGMLFGLLRLSEIVPDLLAGAPSRSASAWNVPTNPVHVHGAGGGAPPTGGGRDLGPTRGSLAAELDRVGGVGSRAGPADPGVAGTGGRGGPTRGWAGGQARVRLTLLGPGGGRGPGVVRWRVGRDRARAVAGGCGGCAG